MEITSENYIDAAEGLHWYCTDYHEGQWSALYEIQCRLEYTPSCLSHGPAPDSEAQYFYDALVSGEITAANALVAIQACNREEE